jgi:PPOX class probable F420-dependent enzyme
MEADDDAPGSAHGLDRVEVERAGIAPPEGHAKVRQAPLEQREVRDATREALELVRRTEAGAHDDRLEAVSVPGDRDRAVGLEHRPMVGPALGAHGVRRRAPGDAGVVPESRWRDYPVDVFEERPDIRARLDAEIVIWLTTVNTAGQAQSSPVWFLAHPDHFVVYSLADTPRVRNIRSNGRVSLNLNSTPDGTGLVIVEGRAEIVDGADPADQDREYLAKYDAEIIREGMTAASFARDYPVRIHIHPTRLRAS